MYGNSGLQLCTNSPSDGSFRATLLINVYAARQHGVVPMNVMVVMSLRNNSVHLYMHQKYCVCSLDPIYMRRINSCSDQISLIKR